MKTIHWSKFVCYECSISSSFLASPIENPDLFERSEIVALFNTFNRLSESLHAIQKFRTIYMKQMAPKVSVCLLQLNVVSLTIR